MPSNRINSVEMYGITRCKSKNGKALYWQVTMKRLEIEYHSIYGDEFRVIHTPYLLAPKSDIAIPP